MEGVFVYWKVGGNIFDKFNLFWTYQGDCLARKYSEGNIVENHFPVEDVPDKTDASPSWFD